MKYLLVWFIALQGCLLAQDSLQLENILEQLEEGADQQYDVLLVLRHLKDNPIFINRASLKELLRIPFLSEKQARNILTYRGQHGPILSASDLTQVPGFSRELVAFLIPYIRFTGTQKPLRLQYRITSASSNRWEAEGDTLPFTRSLYVSHKLMLSVANRFQAVVLNEKDALEPNWTDFTSMSLNWIARQETWQVVAGDYTIAFGQGLVQSKANGLPVSLYGRPIFVRRLIQVRQKFSFNEWAYLRGGAATIQFTPYWEGGAFFSRRRYDARLQGDTLVTTLYRTGYHRDSRDMENRNRLGETLIGTWHRFSKSSWNVGVLLRGRSFSHPIVQNGRAVAGKVWDWHSSVALQFDQEGVRFSAEVAWQAPHAGAWQTTLRIVMARWQMGVAGFYYSREFFSLQGRRLGGFASWATNRKGLYGYLEGSLKSRWRLTLFWWATQKLWEPEQSQSPLQTKAQLQLEHRGVGGDRIILRLGYKDENWISFQPVWYTRVHFTIRRLKVIQLRTRLQWIRSSFESNRMGFVGYQEIQWRQRRFLLGSRWTMFDIPEPLPGVYQVEPDVQGYVRSVYYSTRGYRWIVFIKIPLVSRLSLHAKYMLHVLASESTQEKHLSSRQQELRLQIQWRL